MSVTFLETYAFVVTMATLTPTAMPMPESVSVVGGASVPATLPLSM